MQILFLINIFYVQYINSVGIKIIFKFEYGSCVPLYAFWLSIIIFIYTCI